MTYTSSDEVENKNCCLCIRYSNRHFNSHFNVRFQELPYHLEQLLDNNRLIRCLLEWPVFNRLFSEDFSIDLLHSWRKAGGYSVASALYKESCKVLKASGISLVEYGDQIEKVIMFL